MPVSNFSFFVCVFYLFCVFCSTLRIPAWRGSQTSEMRFGAFLASSAWYSCSPFFSLFLFFLSFLHRNASVCSVHFDLRSLICNSSFSAHFRGPQPCLVSAPISSTARLQMPELSFRLRLEPRRFASAGHLRKFLFSLYRQQRRKISPFSGLHLYCNGAFFFFFFFLSTLFTPLVHELARRLCD